MNLPEPSAKCHDIAAEVVVDGLRSGWTKNQFTVADAIAAGISAFVEQWRREIREAPAKTKEST